MLMQSEAPDARRRSGGLIAARSSCLQRTVRCRRAALSVTARLAAFRNGRDAKRAAHSAGVAAMALFPAGMAADAITG
jgi:hypothetical protein